MQQAQAQETGARVAVVIPAFNEEETVAGVIRVARELTPEVVVASDGSSDRTAQVARDAGARVVELHENVGKGPALKAALEATTAEYVVMLDADLMGLTRDHLEQLLRPVRAGKLDMAIGVFEGGGFASDWGNKLTPHLSGQRACRRDWLLAVPRLGDERWPEPPITDHLRATGALWGYVELGQVRQVLKETKRGFWKGVSYRTKMYADLLTYKRRKRREG
ncbi:glycosyltransferase family 2 protein [Deinococcus metallilatus]|uniref:Glycosyltransferase family 2 protein n=2 Tax=Deinococcus TaxID=1298 RepID=A0AAJ5JYC9_9DEIO|nr:glycosyltransferase involved in cell wall biosynthesis [Deinococcus metallilatus]QBY08752.1 glycosyltransferase family 2 protein [Deinococcus metallilatus]RXJ10632.1 glycosyltransferase family 2 protein [Deinococcus metallilatus]TLK26603.1 glycosyltransferase family 2 protein [Deinococcus metallilatus]